MKNLIKDIAYANKLRCFSTVCHSTQLCKYIINYLCNKDLQILYDVVILF